MSHWFPSSTFFPCPQNKIYKNHPLSFPKGEEDFLGAYHLVSLAIKKFSPNYGDSTSFLRLPHGMVSFDGRVLKSILYINLVSLCVYLFVEVLKPRSRLSVCRGLETQIPNCKSRITAQKPAWLLFSEFSWNLTILWGFFEITRISNGFFILNFFSNTRNLWFFDSEF